MSIVINATSVSAHLTGIGRYALEVSRGILAADPTATAWVCQGGEDPLQAVAGQVRFASSSFAPFLGAKAHLRRLAWSQGLASRSALRRGEVLFACSPLELAIHHPRQVATIHDLTPLLFPRQHQLQAHIFRHVLPRLVRHCRRLIVPSKHTRDHLAEAWRIPVENITVIPHGISDLFLNPPTDPLVRPHDRPYLLWVGRAHPIKNLPMVLAIHAWLLRQGHDLDLLMTGHCPTWVTPPTESRDHVHFLGAIGDLLLRDLYHHAELLLLPSWNEGFGLPAVEALASGCPVVGTDHGALSEMGEPDLHVGNPHNLEQLAHLAALVLRQDRRARLHHPRERYRWQRSVDQHLSCLLTVARGEKRAGSDQSPGKHVL